MKTAPDVILLVGRILFAVFFVNAAVGHFTGGGMRIAMARQARMPLASLAGWPAGLWLGAAALSVAAGIWPDIGCLMIAVFVLPTAYYIHPYWKSEDPGAKYTQQMNFLRNISMLGAALALFAFFATAGFDLKLVLTNPLIDLR